MNQSPSNRMQPSDQDRDRPLRRCPVSLFEVLIVVAIPSSLCSLLLPAVNIMKEHNGESPALPWLDWLFQLYDGIFILLFPVLCVLLAFICLVLLKSRLPAAWKDYFAWRNPKGK